MARDHYRPPSSGGTFNFQSYELSHETLGEPLYAQHEREHSGFARGTIYGVVQVAAESLYAETASRDLARFKWVLFRSSLDTHERGATYCSIKWFPASEQNRLLSLLPPSYLAAYSDVADLVDATFASTYTQYSLAKTLVNRALNSPMQELLCQPQSSIRLGEFNVPPDFSPNDRWGRLADSVRAAGPESIAKRILELLQSKIAAEGFVLRGSVDDDATWLALTAAAAETLDHWLHDAVEAIVGAIAEDVRAVPSQEYDAISAAVVEAISRAAGRPTRAIHGPTSPTTPADWAAQISNPNAVDGRNAPELRGEEVLAWFDSGSGAVSAVVTAADASRERAEWLLAADIGKEMLVRRCRHADVINALQVRLHRAHVGMPIRKVGIFADFTTIDALSFVSLAGTDVSLARRRRDDGSWFGRTALVHARFT
jgi:hypothetical protein